MVFIAVFDVILMVYFSFIIMVYFQGFVKQINEVCKISQDGHSRLKQEVVSG